MLRLTPNMVAILLILGLNGTLWAMIISLSLIHIYAKGNVVNNGFRYYTDPSFWDDYRNKLILLGMISPDVTTDVIKSITDKGEKRNGYMPTFFHGDHASVFVAGNYLRGLKDFDLNRAYKLLVNNATVPGKGGRPYLDEYIEQGWIAEKDTTNVPVSYTHLKTNITAK